MKIKNPKDFWAGLMFIAFGLLAIFLARNYRMGTAMSMGPGYFPTVLGLLMAAIGSIVFFRSFMLHGEKVPMMSFRAIFFVILPLLLFGYLLKPIGLAISIFLLVFVSSFAGYEIKIKEVLILSIVLIILSMLVFVSGLGLPFTLWPPLLT